MSNATISPPGCVLCGSQSVVNIRTISLAQIVSAWKRRQVALSPDPVPLMDVQLWHCKTCHLDFFLPTIVGDAIFYAQLGRLPWYYLEDKWEYARALSDISEGDKVLEIGCGRGNFIRLLRQRGVNATGFELSPDAAADARKQGLDVDVVDVTQYTTASLGQFDVVCHFQVLEHVPEPRRFWERCVALLKPGGRLIISTPNQDSFLQYLPGPLLNMPPHHQSRWRHHTYEIASQMFNLKLLHFDTEPLSKLHSGAACVSALNRLLCIGLDDPTFFPAYPSLLPRLLFRFTSCIGGHLLEGTRLRSRLRGHSLYALLLKP